MKRRRKNKFRLALGTRVVSTAKVKQQDHVMMFGNLGMPNRLWFVSTFK